MDQIKAQAKSKRIIAFDILRGFFLVVILINHIELYPSGFDLFTGRGRLMVSAAEGFFFMSGLLLGIVYKKRLALGMKFIFKKLWTRAFQLYFLSVVCTLLFTALAFRYSHIFIKDSLFVSHNWHTIIWQSLQLRYSFGWADFLARFAKLIVFAPFVIYLLSRRKAWLLILISLGVWLFRGQSFTAAWQIIFYGGMVLGYYWTELSNRWLSLKLNRRTAIKRAAITLAVASFIFSWAGVYVLSLLNQRLSASPIWLQNFTFHWNSLHNYVWIYAQKWTLGPLRIFLFLLWFSVLFMAVNKYHRPISKYSAGILELFGRNSLFVYISHAFIIFGFKIFAPRGTRLFQNFVITLSALMLLVIVTRIYARGMLSYKAGQNPDQEKQRRYRMRAKIAES